MDKREGLKIIFKRGEMSESDYHFTLAVLRAIERIEEAEKQATSEEEPKSLYREKLIAIRERARARLEEKKALDNKY